MTMKKNAAAVKAVKKAEKQENIVLGKHDFLKKVGEELRKLDATEIKQKDLAPAFDAMCSIIENEVRHGHAIRIIGFGTFQQKVTPARMGRNPQTGKEMQIPESKRLAFHSTVKY